MQKKQWKGLPVVIFGTAGFAFEIQTAIKDINSKSHLPVFNLLGFVSEKNELLGRTLFDEQVGGTIVASDATFKDYASKFNVLGVALGIGTPKIKQAVWNKILKDTDNLVFPNIISPFCNLGNKSTIKMGIGNIILAGVSITWNIKFGNFTTININCTIGHESIIKDFATIHPLSAISGLVTIGQGTLIGARSAIKDNIVVGDNAIVGMGTTVVKDVPDNATVIGQAAKLMT